MLFVSINYNNDTAEIVVLTLWYAMKPIISYVMCHSPVSTITFSLSFCSTTSEGPSQSFVFTHTGLLPVVDDPDQICN